MSGNIVCYRFLRSLKTPCLGGGIFEGFWGILRVLARLRSIIPLVLVGSKLDCALPPEVSGVKIDWAIHLPRMMYPHIHFLPFDFCEHIPVIRVVYPTLWSGEQVTTPAVATTRLIVL